MPNPNALWIVTTAADSAPAEQVADLNEVLSTGGASIMGGSGRLGQAVSIEFPEFKTGTLSGLLTLSEALVKHDQVTNSILAKTIETIRSLTTAQAGPTVPGVPSRVSPLSSHLLVGEGTPYFDYLFPTQKGQKEWVWNGKYRTDSRTLGEVVDGLMKELAGIDNAQRNKSGQYAVVKTALATATRKKAGNLSVRSLADVVSESDFAGTNESEYLETALVAVPKNAVKEFESTYERLASMVVPRSATKLASDDEFVLYGVGIFRKVRDEFAQKCREHKYIVRDFKFDESEIEQQKKDLAALEIQEKDLWTDLLRLSRINFSEGFQVLVHLKVVRAYVESVLRYGLPANYFMAVIKPEPKQGARLLGALSTHLAGVASSAGKIGVSNGATGGGEGEEGAAAGEYAGVLENDYFDFVLFEIEKLEG